MGQPKRYPSGIVHHVYDLGKYVIKIEGEYAQVLEHQANILNQLHGRGAKVPKAIDYGKVGDKEYLLMEKIEGNNVVYDWMKMSMPEREHIIAGLAHELQIYHAIKFDQYAISITSGTIFTNLSHAIDRVANFNRIDKEAIETQYRGDIEFLENYFHQHKNVLDEVGTAVLVHNDIHLENIFHIGNKISGIIDFDWVCQAPKDYELWKIVEVAREPKLTVEEKLEPLYEGYRMDTEFRFLKKYYPALFDVPHLAERIRLFYLGNKIIDRIEDWQKGVVKQNVFFEIIQKEIYDLFKTDWLDKLLA